MANRPNEFPKFTSIDAVSLNNLAESYISEFREIIKMIYGKSVEIEVDCDKEVIKDIITRIEKRRVYFHIYHNGTKMGEINEVSLICFWIIKLMPFKHKNIPNSNLNIKIAYNFIAEIVLYVTNEKGINKNIGLLQQRNLLYAFKYRDLSKEAIMAIAESLIC